VRSPTSLIGREQTRVECFSSLRGESKPVWVSLGERLVYRIDCDRPCWQEFREEDIAIPPWRSDFFGEDIRSHEQRFDSNQA
jgi:hypothetical protein